MRIGIDARELTGHATGVGRYLACILDEWAATGEAARHSFILYFPETPSSALQHRLTSLRPTIRVVPGTPGTWWEQVQFAAAVRRDGPDVLFAPAYTAPLRVACPTVLTIHDLSYLAHPEWFRPRERWRRAALTRLSARRARRVLTDSAFSCEEVVRLLGVPRDRVDVIPLGLGMSADPAASAGREPLVLYVGSLLNRRRLPDLVRAFARVARHRPDARLAIVGEDRTWPPQDLAAIIRENDVAGRVDLCAYLADAELADLYFRASAFVFLSEYEGFGLTPLEALAHGVPIVVLDTPVAREVYLDAACYVAAGDIAGTAAAVVSMLDGGVERTQLLAAAARVLPRYTWPAAAAHTIKAIESAAV